MSAMKGFAEFKGNPAAREMFSGFGLQDYLDSAFSWSSLRTFIVEFNGCDQGRFVKLARNRAATCSSGERVLLHAILYATDFAWLADELDGGGTWRRFDRVSGDHRKAVASCIGAEFI